MGMKSTRLDRATPRMKDQDCNFKLMQPTSIGNYRCQSMQPYLTRRVTVRMRKV
jgi:hypothetical protein